MRQLFTYLGLTDPEVVRVAQYVAKRPKLWQNVQRGGTPRRPELSATLGRVAFVLTFTEVDETMMAHLRVTNSESEQELQGLIGDESDALVMELVRSFVGAPIAGDPGRRVLADSLLDIMRTYETGGGRE